MDGITYAVSVDVNNPIIPYNVYVASVLDSNVRYLEITLYENGNIITLSNTATATASLVTDNVLVNDSVNCTIQDNIITVPLEDLQRHGNLDVQVTVTEGTKVLAIPFPIQVRVTPNIAENAQIDENSLGSYAEVVHEITEARGTHTTLHDAITAKLEAIPYSVKLAMDTLFSKAAYADDDAASSYATFHAWAISNLVTFITAVFTQGSATIHDTDSLDTLKQYLTVTATYSDSTTATVTDYTLSGTLAEGTSTITVSYGGKTTTFNVNVTEDSTIPDAYQEVEYIESTGTQYINTGISPNSDYVRVLAKYYKAAQANGEEALFYGFINAHVRAGFEIGFSSTANDIFAFSSTSARVVDEIVYGNVVDLEAVFQATAPTAKITLSSGSTTVTGEKTTANNSDIRIGKIDLFGGGNGYLNTAARLYSTKIYNAANNLLLDLVPCYRKSNTVIGMYDRVSGTFFTNNGSGAFLKGADV